MPEHGALLTALAVASVAALVVPHLLPLHRVAPSRAAAIWTGALALRALLAMSVAAAALMWVPHYSALAPALWIAASGGLFLTLVGTVAWELRRTLRERSLGAGPEGSTVIADRSVYVALTGVGPARVLVSAAALGQLDQGELSASIAHEHGHRALRHRGWSLTGAALHALARPLPAGQACRRGLRLGLERQADEYAVTRTSDPLALASAICKVAPGASPAGAMGAGSSPADLRVTQLMRDEPTRGSTRLERTAMATAATLFGLAALVAATLGATVSSYS